MSRSVPAVRPQWRSRLVVLWWLIGAVVVLGSVALVGSAAVQANAVRDALAAALPELTALRAEAAGVGEPAIDPAAVRRIERAVDGAVAHTTGLDWWFAERVPVLGENFLAVRTAATAGEVVVTDVLEPLSGLRLDRVAVDGRLDLTAVGDIARTAARALERLADHTAALDRVDRSALLPEVARAFEEIDEPLQHVSSAAAALGPLVRSVPAMLGADGPRDVVVLFQNSAESRALGGIAGASVLLHLDDGAVTVTRAMGGRDFVAHTEPVVPLPADAAALYRVDGAAVAGTTIHETTARPDFVYGARVASALWQESQGVTPDLVVAVDPLALSYVLRATGPVVLGDGTALTEDTLVARLLNGVYRDSGALDDASNDVQDAYFSSVVRAVVAEVPGGAIDVPAAARAGLQAVEERRLLVWSPDRVEERAIVRAGAGGVLPETTATAVPFGLYLSDAVGSKLEYYLRQSVRVSAGRCPADGSRTMTIDSTFTNTVDSVADFADEEYDYIAGEYRRVGLPRGEMRLRVLLYVPEGAEIASVLVDGQEVPFTSGADDGRPVAAVMLSIPPGAQVALSAQVRVPDAARRRVDVEVTPGVVPAVVEDTVTPCG